MNKKGFTLIELLVVIAIIGVLSTLAVVALGSARQKANDAKRLSDIKQIQTALELYYTDNNAYPTTTASPIDLGDTNYACLNTSGFTTAGCSSPYMGLVPKGPDTNENYDYVSTDGTGYTIHGVLTAGAGGFAIGTVTATESGMTQ
ncbi:MAG: type II secretion system protein [Candidatus Magasanikbacteria bacterium]